jgi:phosphoglycolate/pyridoxal phosphate phosphatase family enzyme
MKNLSAVTKQEQKQFFDSFDHVLFDVDGVLWLSQNNIPGASDAVKSLKNLGKGVSFVSNNCTRTHDEYYAELKAAGYDLDKNDLVLPVLAMIDYLQKRNFTKEIYLIGMTPMRSQLQKAGFKIADPAPDSIEESVPKFVQMSIAKNDKVGAVIADLDLNVNVLKLQKAATYLKDPEVIFITGGSDRKLCFGPGQFMIGPGAFQEVIEDITGRKGVRLAKPGSGLNDFIKEKFGLKDASRVLFVGDSVPQDMGFATKCGYKRLLVLSGLTQKEEVTTWRFAEELRPEYYVDSLKDVYEMLK